MNGQLKRYLQQGSGETQAQDLLPHGLGVCHRPGMHVFAHQKAGQTPCFGDFVEASSHRSNQSLMSFSALLPSEASGDKAENVKLLIMAYCFW